MPKVSKEQFCLILDYCTDYEHFHSTSCQLAHDLISQKRFIELSNLEEAITVVSAKYNTDAYINILEHISLYTAYMLHGDKKTEKNYKSQIIRNFNNIFPNLEFISSEYKVSDLCRIDILAKEKETGKFAIIELKTNNSNPTPQLERYSKYFKEPLQIGITEKQLKNSIKKKGIIYYTYSDLGL